MSNPGEFTLTVLDDSLIRLTDSSGTSMAMVPLGPACDDNTDNDLDGGTDYGFDADCADEQDANERLAGMQPYESPTMLLEIAATGAITVDPSEFSAPEFEHCPITVSGTPWCLGVQPVGVGDPQSGSINPNNGQINVPLSIIVELHAISGFDGLDAACHLGPVSGMLSATNYDESTGLATLAAYDLPLPEVSSCGASWNSTFNSLLGLPGELDVLYQATILDGSGTPLLLD